MDRLYNTNGLVFWSEKEILLRRQMEEYFALHMKDALLSMNSAWSFHRIEGPILTPPDRLNKNYGKNDVFFANDDLALRPETTPSSYAYACHLLNTHSGVKPPFVVWQSGKSFRNEKNSELKHMRLKEFWQQEFQCIYAADTLNDYLLEIIDPVSEMIRDMVNNEVRIVESDRLPDYSEITMDVEAFVENGVGSTWHSDMQGDWLELCSISRRTDFPQPAMFQTKKGIVTKDLKVLEVAIGLDRCVYAKKKAR